MRFIESWAYSCANYIATQLGENHEKRRVYYYSFQVIFGELIKILIILIISSILGFLKPVLACLAAFIFIRTAAGGYHMNTHTKCFIASLLMFILSGAIVKYTYLYWELYLTISFILVTGVVSLIVFINRAPADTPNKPITNPKIIKKLKARSLIYLALCMLVSLFLTIRGSNMYALSVTFGLILEVFTVTAVGYRFFEIISKSNKQKNV